ncbi:O-antigen ligase family protein [Devosia sp. A8/3-2]|nr:O-antigen ligase family protein [Devosia sp. A8/3-2]
MFSCSDRRAGPVNNPIHLAALGLALGFVSLIGIWGTGRLRAIFLLGPLLGIVTVYLTGSRGPTVAAAQMLLVAAAAVCFSRLPTRTARRVVGSGMVIIAAIVVLFSVTGVADELTPTGKILSLLRTGVTSDTSTAERLIMYQSAFNAFLASPSWATVCSTTRQRPLHMPPVRGLPALYPSPQRHR